MTHPVRSRLWAGLAAGVLVVAAPVAAAGTAHASTTPASTTPEKVPTGLLASALPGAAPFGTTPSDTPEQVSFILKERNKGALEGFVTGGSRRYDSVGQFAAKYGQSPQVVKALTGYLGKFGIKTKVYPGNIDVSATGTAGEFDAALSTRQKNYHVPSQDGSGGQNIPAQTVYSATAAPKLPAWIATDVLAVLGLTNYAPFVSHAQHEATGNTVTGNPGSHLPSDFAQNYGLTGVGAKADGAGQTVGIVTLAAVDPGAPQYFWQNVAKVPATGRTLTVDDVDGGAGAPSDAAGTGETDLDVEQSGALAPGANVIVYQTPNTDPGFIDGFFTAASSNKAASLSTSWGESETVVAAAVAAGQETAAYQAAFDEVFLELADQGTSVFDAAGDAGAYDDSDELGTTELVVDTPADSPFATAAGGTTLPWSGTVSGPGGSAGVSVARQRAWGLDYLWQAEATAKGISYADAATMYAEGGGGGFSAVEPKPAYQKWVTGTSSYQGVQYFTPTDPQVVVTGTDFTEPTSWDITATPPLVSGHGSGRAVPDLSADADPETGYLLYEPSAVAAGGTALEGGWGGTSFVAPQFNGSAALIDSYLGHRAGLWNAALYTLADTKSSPVTPLNAAGTSNDNLFYTGQPGKEYNEATGLGVPNFTKLASGLAR